MSLLSFGRAAFVNIVGATISIDSSTLAKGARRGPQPQGITRDTKARSAVEGGHQDRYISLDELHEANTAAKPWVAIRGKVYDLTNFVNKHPGGKTFLLLSVGRDTTALYESLHSEKQSRVLEYAHRSNLTFCRNKADHGYRKYCIGKLEGNGDVPQYAPQSPFYEEVRTRVDQFFKTQGISNPRHAPQMLWRYGIVCVFFFLTYYAMWTSPSSWISAPIPWIGAALHGWSCAMMGLYLLHDGCHASFSASPVVWTVLRRVYESFTGLSSLYWFCQHTMGHHPYTNVKGADPDINFDGGLLRVHDGVSWMQHHPMQKYYCIPLYSQLALSRKVTEWKMVFIDHDIKGIKINPLPTSEYIWSAVTAAVYIFQHYVVPLAFLNVSIWRLLVLHTVVDMVWSSYLSIIFMTAHVNDDVAWPQANPETGIIDADWATMQIESSLDFSHGDKWTTFFCGALNYQAVHHLFPCVSQAYYPDIAPIVKEVAKKYGVRYNLTDSLYSGFKKHITRLELLGDENFPALR